MKQLIAIFFLLIMCGPLLSAFTTAEQQGVVLFTATEEEHHEHSKEKKDDKAFSAVHLHALPYSYLKASFPHADAFILEAPSLGNLTPPPDRFC